jgi:hypothetical protein
LSEAFYFVKDKTTRPGSRSRVPFWPTTPPGFSSEMTFQNPAKASEGGLTYGSTVDFRGRHAKAAAEQWTANAYVVYGDRHK